MAGMSIKKEHKKKGFPVPGTTELGGGMAVISRLTHGLKRVIRLAV